jgi:hypothetical protein
MSSELNALFEEGVTRSRELADAADEAIDTIDGLVERAEALSQRVKDEGGEACGHLRDLAGRLEQAGRELEAARGHAEGALEGLSGSAADLKAEVAELLELVHKDLADLEARQSQMQDSVETQAAAAQTDFTELARQTQEAEKEATAHLEQAESALAGFRAGLAAARAEFAQKQQALEGALQDLEANARRQVETWLAGVDELLAEQAQAMTETANVLVDRHNEAMQHLKQRLVQETPPRLSGALAPLQAGLEGLGGLASERQQALSARAQELAQAALQALPMVEQIRAVLESTARVE